MALPSFMRPTLFLALHHLLLCRATRPLDELVASSALDVQARGGGGGGGASHAGAAALKALPRETPESTGNASGSAFGAHRGPSIPVALVQANETAHQVTEYELVTERKSQSKVMLIFVVFLGLGFCGVDHCLVGNFILGTLKLLTVGGFGFWFLLDWMLIVFNCVNQYDTLTGFGWDLAFSPCGIEDACRMGQVTCLLHAPFVLTLVKAKLSGRSVQSSVQQPAVSTVAFLRQKGLVSESPAGWEVDHVFETLDRNKNGVVNGTELKEGLAALGCAVTDEQVQELMAGAGPDGISKSELARVIASCDGITSRGPPSRAGGGRASLAAGDVDSAPADKDAAKADGS